MERLDHDRLVEEQEVTLRTPRRRASLSARVLFRVMDALYGEERTLEKFRVLELVASAPPASSRTTSSGTSSSSRS
jgi:hypothetical protein